MGRAAYMSPKQAERRQIDERSDIKSKDSNSPSFEQEAFRNSM